MTDTHTLSLLWPQGQPDKTEHRLHAQSVRDLGLDSMLGRLGASGGEMEAILRNLCTDTAVIAYRQDILADLLAHDALVTQLEKLLPTMDNLGSLSWLRGANQKSNLFEVTFRLGELENLIIITRGIQAALANKGLAADKPLAAAGLLALQAEITTLTETAVFQQLEAELPTLLEEIRAVQSITIGINLDDNLMPIEATLVAINKENYTNTGFIDRLLGKSGHSFNGLTDLRSMPGRKTTIATSMALNSKTETIEPMLVPLFRDLALVMEKTCEPIIRALKQYAHLNGRLFINLKDELRYYLVAVKLIQSLAAHNMPICRPSIAPMEARLFQVQANYNINLYTQLSQSYHKTPLAEQIIANDVQMDENGRIFILTGPNQGGKTTYIQAIGLTQLLAQAGLWVPGSQATISPVDAIYTHFPLEEKLERGTGRFGDEAQRLNEIFQEATPHSLVLLNESLASTAVGESIYLAQDIVRIMRMVGLRAIFATHFHELAETADQLNADTPGSSAIVSLVASRIDTTAPDQATALRRSYHIQPGPPMGRSFARELAQKYGMSYEQLTDMLAQRGLIQQIKN